jgi:hypothetical protein
MRPALHNIYSNCVAVHELNNGCIHNFLPYQIRLDEMGGACSMYKEKINAYKI